MFKNMLIYPLMKLDKKTLTGLVSVNIENLNRYNFK